MLLSHGRALYSGPGGLAPVKHFKSVRELEVAQGSVSEIPKYEEGYNVADHLLEIASAAPVGLFSSRAAESHVKGFQDFGNGTGSTSAGVDEKAQNEVDVEALLTRSKQWQGDCTTTFLTQFEVLCGREWKIIRR